MNKLKEIEGALNSAFDEFGIPLAALEEVSRKHMFIYWSKVDTIREWVCVDNYNIYLITFNHDHFEVVNHSIKGE